LGYVDVVGVTRRRRIIVKRRVWFEWGMLRLGEFGV
jgi:hypothetical protein